MKRLYVSAWFLLVSAVLVSLLTGFINPETLLGFGIIALALFFAFALRQAIAHTGETTLK